MSQEQTPGAHSLHTEIPCFPHNTGRAVPRLHPGRLSTPGPGSRKRCKGPHGGTAAQPGPAQPSTAQPSPEEESTGHALTRPPSSNGPTWENQAREQNQVGMITVGPLEVNTWKQLVWTQLTEKNSSSHNPQVISHKVTQKVTSKCAHPFPVGTKVQGALEPGQWCPAPKADRWAQSPPRSCSAADEPPGFSGGVL